MVEPVESIPALWQWPPRAAFGRPIPKSKFYERAAVSTRVRELFVDQIAQIIWAFKLSPTTVGLAATDAIPEIDVLEITLKPDVDDVSDDLLTVLNRAIPAPLLLEIRRHPAVGAGGDAQRLTATPTKDRRTTFVSTPWLPSPAERSPLPPALDLAGLHTALLAPLMPHAVRPGESLAELAERAGVIRVLEREIATLRRRVRAERQFNRRAEINRTLRERTAALTALTTTPTSEESPWRS
ncbi:DUF4391 domain-containing protein [Cellulomonas wangsupingiae]|uniref:DUF4391 domain-containing protein n=1 Tax=Cellulomonas wangsupingiae TaxID=2968085 RepID=A0ABY5K6V8_9CELL|nr:DUF4391 domain-containing protein [Cellulomonas wangsupingiae]MCC2333614.1 DUF4391 domain-containing protein [Cellulomonas wangsupingiae]UUI64882.1 DUF4391 domain-containing protein [Cellulomonas wangsupingiae]